MAFVPDRSITSSEEPGEQMTNDSWTAPLSAVVSLEDSVRSTSDGKAPDVKMKVFHNGL